MSLHVVMHCAVLCDVVACCVVLCCVVLFCYYAICCVLVLRCALCLCDDVVCCIVLCWYVSLCGMFGRVVLCYVMFGWVMLRCVMV